MGLGLTIPVPVYTAPAGNTIPVDTVLYHGVSETTAVLLLQVIDPSGPLLILPLQPSL